MTTPATAMAPDVQFAVTVERVTNKLATSLDQYCFAFIGASGAGKDTAARLICDKIWNIDTFRFAQPIDELAYCLWGEANCERSKSTGTSLWAGKNRDQLYLEIGEALRERLGQHVFAQTVVRKIQNRWLPNIGTYRHGIVTDLRRAQELQLLIDAFGDHLIVIEVHRPSATLRNLPDDVTRRLEADYRKPLADLLATLKPQQHWAVLNDCDLLTLQQRLVGMLDNLF